MESLWGPSDIGGGKLAHHHVFLWGESMPLQWNSLPMKFSAQKRIPFAFLFFFFSPEEKENAAASHEHIICDSFWS